MWYAILTALFFFTMSILFLILGVKNYMFGRKFMNEALETYAAVEKKFMRVTHKNGGSTKHYYFYLRIEESDLMGTAKIKVKSQEFYATAEGDTVRVYYLPDDIKHVARTKKFWLSESVTGFIASICFFGVFLISAYYLWGMKLYGY